jgi:serine/threonine-protein kinase
MSLCRSCSAELPDGSKFCLKCGKAKNGATSPVPVDPVGMETMAMDEPAPSGRGAPPASPRSMFSSSATSGLERHRFEPGSLLASRYRIISRLGKGGMGEVYRAEDIVLGQSVALKFLPESSTGNLNLLKRFYDEARIARQITHPNVCRVYDIGEIEGQPYLSMEYIDGEDLASLLRRIGRLPTDKATEFARKMCAGLSAAHTQGVLHRDLKPANIMVDGRGELRITDFGLAAVGAQVEGNEMRNGTPAYMAPEQLEGREVSVASDIYALGLVFYEMFTGKPPHQGETLAEILKQRKESSLTNPSNLVTDLDPVVEKAILRCLDPDPKRRPASAMALAASLPGGDPLAMALAAGETPSPELVAASGSNEGLRPKVACAALGATAAGLILFFVLAPKIAVINHFPLEDRPEVMSAKARDLVKAVGYADRPADAVYGYADEDGYEAYLGQKVKGEDNWSRTIAVAPFPAFFWYRQSPNSLVPVDFRSDATVTLSDPFPSVPEMATVTLEMDGTLRSFMAVPPERDSSSSTSAPDWTAFFKLANLDITTFQKAAPEWVPPATADTRAAWTGTYPSPNNIPIRVEAASFQGKPVYFTIVWPWTKPAHAKPNPASALSTIVSNGFTIIWWMVNIGAIWVARLNLKAGRGDARGAFRVGLAIGLARLLVWALEAHHVPITTEERLFNHGLGMAVLEGIRYWIFYLALEPWVRRYWPQALLTWARVISGKVRNPLVGRDILYAVLFGTLYSLFILAYEFWDVRTGDGYPSGDVPLRVLMGLRAVSSIYSQNLYYGITNGLQFFLMLFLLRALVRKPWIAAVLLVAIFVTLKTATGSHSGPIIWGFWTIIYGILVFLMLRFGMFALIVTMFVINTSVELYFTPDYTAWYGISSLAMLLVTSGLALWGFRVSLGGRRLFNTAALEKG